MGIIVSKPLNKKLIDKLFAKAKAGKKPILKKYLHISNGYDITAYFRLITENGEYSYIERFDTRSKGNIREKSKLAAKYTLSGEYLYQYKTKNGTA